MTLSERRTALIEEKRLRSNGVKIEKPLEVCANCVRWRRHYVAADPASVAYCMPHFVPTPYGHCTYPRLKHRKETDTCKYFCTLKDMSEEELMEEMTREWQLM